MPAQKIPTKNIVDAFIAHYEESHGSNYLVNFPMVKSLEKVAQFYTLGMILDAMNHYFTVKSKHSLWEFIDHIDKWAEGAGADARAASHIRDLMDKTNNKLSKIRGDSEQSGVTTDLQGVGDEGSIESL